jgi:hypothetical protein
MEESIRHLDHVDARLHYLTGGSTAAHPIVQIYDARPLSASLSLDMQGFALNRRKSAVANFYDANQVRALYYREVEQLVQDVTGAARVLAFEHDVRCGPKAARAVESVREPVKVVHDDYTAKSAPERVRLYLPDEADVLLNSRYAVINVWRPINGPVEQTPLAVCDARTLTEDDVVRTEEGVKHEVYLFNFRPGHHWFYFPQMADDEALLIKCFDSLSDGRARLTAHSAFDDPAAPPGARPRESIEVRTLAFFAPESN